jgi:triphosphatase
MRKSREISYRFELDPQDCGWLRWALARSGAELTEETHDFALYLDTQGAVIGNRGLALSVRRGGEISSDEVKTAVGRVTQGLPPSQDWTRSVEPLSVATPAEVRRTLDSLLHAQDVRQNLRVFFQIETQGAHWRASMAGSTTAISLDHARIYADRAHESFATVNFVGDGSEDFFRLLADVSPIAKLRMSAESVALRGYRFCGALRNSHVTSFAPKLVANMDATAGFRTIARACLDHFLVNETAVRRTRDCEAVHQCRVALRRFSTCLRLFSSVTSGADYEALRPDLKEITRHLRKVRDLDVLIVDVIAPAVGDSSSEDSKNLLREIEARQNTAYDELIGALSAPQVASLFLRLAKWIETGEWSRVREEWRRENIVVFAQRKLAKAARKFKSHCEEIGKANQEQRHRIRIRAKNLRYSAEFFETLVLPGGRLANSAHARAAHKRFTAFIGVLKDLQTILGKQNDVRMAQHFLASLAEETNAGRITSAAAKILAAGMGTSEADLQSKARKAGRALEEIKPFWSKLSEAA